MFLGIGTDFQTRGIFPNFKNVFIYKTRLCHAFGAFFPITGYISTCVDLLFQIAEVLSKLERVNNETTINLRHLEGGSSQQISNLEGKTMSMIDDTKTKVKSLKAQEESERDKLEMRLNTHLDRSSNKLETRVVSVKNY